MPVIVINMGCEMMYILDQRLRAQNVPPDKGSRVLLDVYKTMFDISFIKDKLCVPQMTSSVQVTRRIFDRLAHSSIMRLSEARFVAPRSAAVLPACLACCGLYRHWIHSSKWLASL